MSTAASRPPRGRYAPSPTGELHLGNASSALLSWWSIRARGGTYVMRVEDLDRARSRAELTEQILDDLEWLGMDWDEGPHTQSEHGDRYEQAFEELRDAGHLYPCFCSRKDIIAAASAPQAPGDELRYAGTCRDIPAEVAEERLSSGQRHAWRLRIPEDVDLAFDDLVHGPCRFDDPGDFVVWRSDGVPAYQLAVVVDDAAMQIDEVVRGDDLLSSASRQILLFRLLDLPEPVFGHVPLLIGPDGARLSKRHQGITLRELRDAGMTAEQIVGKLAGLVGLNPGGGPRTAASLVEGFDLRELEPRPDGIHLDPEQF